MKKLFLLFLLGCGIALASPAFGAGSWSTAGPMSPTFYQNTYGRPDVPSSARAACEDTFTADSSAATVPDLTITATNIKGWYLIGIEMKDGATPPTATTTVTITDDMGATLLTTTWSFGSANPLVWIPVLSNLTVSVGSNAVNSAVGKVRLIFAP